MNHSDDSRRALLEALVAAIARPHDVLSAIETCDTEDQAASAIADLLHIPEHSGRDVLNLQLFRFVGNQRRRIHSDLESLAT